MPSSSDDGSRLQQSPKKSPKRLGIPRFFRRQPRRRSSDSEHIQLAAKLAALEAPQASVSGDSDERSLQRGRRVSFHASQPHVTTARRTSTTTQAAAASTSRIYDDPQLTQSYLRVPILDKQPLPRGGVSIDTAAIGRLQFGIPPETIKDSMRLGLDVPRVYIVPVDRFCREPGPALGLNLAEFEFPAYFNYFIRRKKCLLVVDNEQAEQNILKVFEETLMGPAEFRDASNPKPYNEEDFDPSVPHEARPNFYKEFAHWRAAEKTDQYNELTTQMLVDFVHFESNEAEDHSTVTKNADIGVPPAPADFDDDNDDDHSIESSVDEVAAATQERLYKSFSIIDRTGGAELDNLERFNQSVSAMNHSIASFDAHKPVDNSRGSIDVSQTPAGAVEMNFAPTGRRRSISDWLESDDDSRLRSGSDGGMNDPRRQSLESRRSSHSSSRFSSVCSSTAFADEDQPTKWLYSKVKWMGDLATLWPPDATPEQIKTRSVPRVEVFKMAGGTEYIIHDVDANNVIVGKARFSGTVHVPDEMEVEGFLDEAVTMAPARTNATEPSEHSTSATRVPRPPCFHPPSFGVTILGNSHGFDKNGSTSGYVIWINGRGVMVDPPPFSSATLEREGIRPQMIIAIILTHCHADHDAGAFQKILTGSQVAIITAPSIYKSFIRKYAALSGLSATFLQQSHRYRPAIIGQPLDFQGATMHFNFSLHTIPCLTFKIVWRGHSIVYSGDHCGIPDLIDELQNKGTLSRERADTLLAIPLQECDVLLHEAGVPPIHTPISELQKLPANVRERLYVVHTSALPPDCGLRVAPVGTSGTIRLEDPLPDVALSAGDTDLALSASIIGGQDAKELLANGFSAERPPPQVYFRKASVSDAWFILNLLGNIPFFSSLSFNNTKDVLEIVKVEVFCVGEVIVPWRRRKDVLAVVWEGTCMERSGANRRNESVTVWHAGDWMGPVSLQPDVKHADNQKDVVAVSTEGVKVIMLRMVELEKILRPGSELYRKYLVQHDSMGLAEQDGEDDEDEDDDDASTHSLSSIRFLDVLKFNSVLHRLSPLQQRSLESIAEGPRRFSGGSDLWKVGSSCDYAFLIVTGTAMSETMAIRRRQTSRRTMLAKSISLAHMIELENGRQVEADKVLPNVSPDSEYARLRTILAQRASRISDNILRNRLKGDTNEPHHDGSDRFSNQVLSKLYASKKILPDLQFGRGSFVSDTSRMVCGELVRQAGPTSANSSTEQHWHSSTVIANPGEGCLAYVFPRAALVSFLNANPGVLLSLLGTQVIV